MAELIRAGYEAAPAYPQHYQQASAAQPYANGSGGAYQQAAAPMQQVWALLIICPLCMIMQGHLLCLYIPGALMTECAVLSCSRRVRSLATAGRSSLRPPSTSRTCQRRPTSCGCTSTSRAMGQSSA